MKPNLHKLENLSDDQLETISNHIDTIGIRKAAEQASKDTDRAIDKTCIQRLKERGIARRFLVESPDASQAAAEILRFAVTGRPDFSHATINILEETAFKLSLECAEAEEDGLKALNSITVMLARYRTASVRDRMAQIQEDKLQLRREEFQWKKTIQASKAGNKSELRITNSAIEHDALGPLALTLDDVERRACQKFNQPYNGPTHSTQSSSRGDEAHESPSARSSQPLSNASGPAEADKPLPVASSRIAASLQGAQISDTLNIAPSGNSEPGAPNPNGIPAQSSGSRGTSHPGLTVNRSTQSSSRGDEAHESPSATSSQPLSNTNGTAQSKIRDPHSAIPEPYLQTEKTPSPIVASEGASSSTASGLDPRASHLRISHAIRRWRAHIPWSPNAPEPDGSWRNECPCGNPAPCSLHPALKERVRAYKPQHPDYQLGLKEFNVPYYKPTAGEIGCTQEALDRSCDLFAENPRIKDPPHPVVDPFKQWPQAS